MDGPHVRRSTPLVCDDRARSAGPARRLPGAHGPAAGAAAQGLRTLGVGVRLRQLRADRLAAGGTAVQPISPSMASCSTSTGSAASSTTATSRRVTWAASTGTRTRTPDLKGNPYSFPESGREDQELRRRPHRPHRRSRSRISRDTTDTFQQMPREPLRLPAERRRALRRRPTRLRRSRTRQGFWGIGRMIDWTGPRRPRLVPRQPAVPELEQSGGSRLTGRTSVSPKPSAAPPATRGSETTVSGLKNSHTDIHNLYNLLWNQGIWDGYAAKQGPGQRSRRHQSAALHRHPIGRRGYTAHGSGNVVGRHCERRRVAGGALQRPDAHVVRRHRLLRRRHRRIPA